MRMRRLAAFFLVLLAAGSSLAAARVCVRRLEDEGAPNIYPITVLVNGHKVAALLGGQNACFAAEPGARLSLRWPAFDWQRPDHGRRGKRTENSAAIAVSRLPSVVRVCSRRVQGGIPRWHIGGDNLGEC